MDRKPVQKMNCGNYPRRKGKRGELELARFLTDRGFFAERAQQYKGNAGAQDLNCPEFDKLGLAIECKRVERFNGSVWLTKAMEDFKGERIPVIFWRGNNRPWAVMMLADDFIDIIQRLRVALIAEEASK